MPRALPEATSAISGEISETPELLLPGRLSFLTQSHVKPGIRWELNPFYDGFTVRRQGLINKRKPDHPVQLLVNGSAQTATLYPLFQDRIELSGSQGLPTSVSRPITGTSPAHWFAWNPGRANGSSALDTASSLAIRTITISTTRRTLFPLSPRRL